jgi:hypothetical protein
MTKLQQHYINFQSQPTIPHKILYLQKFQNELSQYNINVNNLINSYTTNQWPWNQPKTDND